jgi:hypothetical protein
VSPTTRSSPGKRWSAGAAASLFAILAFSSACEPKATTSVAWNGREFVEVGSLALLPAAIQDELGAQRAGAEGIAERGARFNTTDVVEPGLPMRRFVVAGVAPDAALVAYERGGRGYSVGILLYTWSGSRVQRVRTWTTYEPPDGLAGLIQSLQPTRPKRHSIPRHHTAPPRPGVKRAGRIT